MNVKEHQKGSVSHPRLWAGGRTNSVQLYWRRCRCTSRRQLESEDQWPENASRFLAQASDELCRDIWASRSEATWFQDEVIRSPTQQRRVQKTSFIYVQTCNVKLSAICYFFIVLDARQRSQKVWIRVTFEAFWNCKWF